VFKQSLKSKLDYSYKSTFLIVCVIAGLCGACNPDCKDIDYGDQYLIDTPGFLFPYESGDTLYFQDGSGHELIFTMNPFLGMEKTWFEFSQDVEDGACKGESKINSRLQQVVTNLRSDSLDYLIICHHYVHSIIDGTKPLFIDIIYASIGGGIATDHRTNDRGNEAYFIDSTPSYTFEEHLALGTKEFEKVYSNTYPNGSQIYFNHEFGIVGFKRGSKPLWVLDRIE